MTKEERLAKVVELKRKLWSQSKHAVPVASVIERFVEAQDGVWEIVLPELRAGRKRGHWMWYVFPQIFGLGTSEFAVRYAIRDLDEAKAYLAHPVLGPRLHEAMEVVLFHQGCKEVREIFSDVDALKLRSCATLFDMIEPRSVFQRVIDVFYGGKRDSKTLELIGCKNSNNKLVKLQGTKCAMIGAIVGDIAGSRFEFHNRKTKAFSLLVSRGEEERSCYFTDDTVMTLAVAQALLDWRTNGSTDMGDLSAAAVSRMQEFGRRYPHAGYGGAFRRWLEASRPQPYNSWGNGAAMRVSACGWAGRTLDEVKAMSRAVTEVTHNHPEGIKGAEATAVCVFLARQGKSKDEIKAYVRAHYYPLDFTLDEIRLGYSFDVSCQGSVPQALEAFFESTSFEDAIRNAISIGGDSDTIGAICGAVAEAFYGVPDEIRTKAMTFLPKHLLAVLDRIESEKFCYNSRQVKGEYRHD